MLLQIFTAAARILLFQAGPQDLPYAPRLGGALIVCAIVANVGVYAQLLPLSVALAMSGTVVAGTGLITRSVLRARGLENRYTQTFHAMLATGTLLTLMLLPPFSVIAPKMMEVAANPELLGKPEQLGVPRGAALLLDILFFWGMAVTGHIFRHAAGLRLPWAVLIAVVGTFAVMFMAVFAGSLVQAIIGTPALPGAVTH